jgi:DNA gyrase subunit A
MAEPTEKSPEKIIPRLIEEEMKKSYIDYAMSVIVGRALPDARDGLKPVHRRILFAMQELGLLHNKPFRKCARIVGDVLGKYHPHGDMAVYDSLVRMAQDFSMRYQLIHGQGNFGSIDGDSPAAMRYTEAKLSRIAEEMLADIDKETVDFSPNFDGSLKEPVVLPSKIPNLLINGSSGIAVGMATNIPPHNMAEIIDATTALIENPEMPVYDMLKYVRGPDFPTGATIIGREGIRLAYTTGRGKVVIKSKSEIIEEKGRQKIIVTEIPYQVNKATMIEEIASLVKESKITGISDIRDESDKDGIRVVIEIKKDSNPQVVLNQLHAHSKMEHTFGIIMLSLVDNEPKVLNLKETIHQFIIHRQKVVRRRTEFELKKAAERAHVLEGLIIALKDIDNVVKKIKASRDVQSATVLLMKDYSLTEIQSKAILDMKLQRLASLEQEKIRKEHEELVKLIKELKDILSSEQKILEIIKKELQEMKEKYGDRRKTEIVEGEEEEMSAEDLIKPEDVVVTVTHAGYIKRMPLDVYKSQGRGGRGIVAADTKEEDFVEDLFIANTHSYILFFTSKGRVHWLKVHELPVASRQARGKAIINLLQLKEDEKVSAFVPVKEFDNKHFLIMATKNGTVKKTNLELYSNPRKGGIIGITIDEGDQLIEVVLTSGTNQIVLATKKGMAARFMEEDVRPCGRSAMGVRGIKLREGDEVVGMVIGEDDRAILTVTENGYGKRTAVSEYRLIGRGGVGVINIQCSERNGDVVAIKTVTDDDELMLVSQKGIMIRVPVKEISVISRNTQGVRLMKLEEGDRLAAAAKIAKE